MSHGDRARIKSNKRCEYWSKRPGSNFCGMTKSKYNKIQTHRIERRNNKNETRNY